MGVVKRVGGRCKRCYTCVRNCPVKAICVEAGEATVLEDLCVSCGTCVSLCSQKAKQAESHQESVFQALGSDTECVAVLAPSFVASFPNENPKQVIHALHELGFNRVVEVAFGAELVARDARRLMTDPHSRKPMISSPCPVVVSLIERHFPHLIKFLTPLVSPMLAIGRYLVEHDSKPSVKVFIGPCIAKKEEIQDPEIKDVIDFALTFRELKEMLRIRGIDPAALAGLPADPPHPGQGRVFPLVGGILKTAGMGTDILDDRIAIIEGHHETLEFLRTFNEDSPPRTEFIDILFCRGCIDGVEMDSELSHLEKHRKVLEFVSESRHLNPSSLPELNLKRGYQDKKLRTMEPTPEEIVEIMRMFGKYKPEDELNCGACGYKTCRAKARAVFQGIAEPEMCLPEIIKQLETTVSDLNVSHEKLKTAQDELVHSEKLASLGQLSAGVAHELNNPLGGILLFSNMLLEKLNQIGRESVPEEIEIIVKEATRCRHIVRGLLDFARQSKLQKTRIDIGELLTEIVTIEGRSASHLVSFFEEYDPNLPSTMLDPVQIRQALTNIIHNGVEAMPQGGSMKVVTRHNALIHSAEILISDTGVGIPESSLSKLFTPFFTTKGIGQGTGLGLAISYGIIKMHRGSVSVQSTVGEGTTFTITLPIENLPEEGFIGGSPHHGSGGR